jgi:hypothetical protein
MKDKNNQACLSNMAFIQEDDENKDDNYFYEYDVYGSDGSDITDTNNNKAIKQNLKKNENIIEHCVCGSLHNGYLQLEELQLVALACFFLSAKFWERFPPKVNILF